MLNATGGEPERILVLAPTHGDAELCDRLKTEADLPLVVCASTAELCQALAGPASVLVIADEALQATAGNCVREALAGQVNCPAMPVIVLVRPQSLANARLLGDYEGYGHITLLERPVKMANFIGTVRMALSERRHQCRIRDQLAEREERLRQRDEFLATLGHELRNPLAAIMTCAEVLDLVGPGAEQAVRCHQVIRNQAAQVKRLLDDILDVARITRRKLQLQPELITLDQVLADAIDQVQGRIAEQSQSLVLERAKFPVPVRADAMRLRQVFANILSNASRYSPPGGRIWVQFGTAGGLAEVRIRDEGAGMTSETLARLFDPFFQGQDAGLGTPRGLGIGLTLARTLVEMHAGIIRATSPGLGRGSEISVTLPAEPPTAMGVVSEAPATRAAAGTLPKQRVLLIEDNQDFSHGLKQLLESRGHQVHLAHNGSLGIRAAAQHRPDVVLLDRGLPDIDGYEVATRLRRLSGLSAARLIMVTGQACDEERRRHDQHAGIHRHLVKPISLSELEAAIAEP